MENKMNTIIIDSDLPLNEFDISQIRAMVNYLIPTEYIDFIKKYNGGVPEPDSFNIQKINDASTINRFLGVKKEKNQNSDIFYFFKVYKNRIPSGYLPIGYDIGGNLILIKLGNDDAKVFFWDHELEADEGEEPTLENIYYLADSINDFLSSLFLIEI
ncbi:SMI1/KNR4 family protein [Providencia rettgeri]|uniref:SMI1/KNR4 family protein n=1 Tax=Providencia rettgeri TaxID=587 RepID=A0AAD2ZLW7_PRORE|nr:SMI1/KNR4 family protein [Providencia rettgeri]ELR5072840.1 SMI1/KNR4 family protein [Providencia stuartii]ELR5215990.1 SMI1/KNR4 family protein [Providencia rettgeri]ELR5222827.1 SMI1/KNR4 family protein [Providencia rettgeri]MDX7322668.1 SMI1/KNR4 family protein [Providencia rettgeri]